MKKPVAPAATARPHALSQHGETRIDPWYWLRDDERESPQVLAHLAKIAGTSTAAEKLYRSQHLEAFGGRTPAQMVRAGELKALVALMRAEAAQNKG